MADPNTTPRFPKEVFNASGDLTVANANRDGTTGTYVTIYTSPTVASGGTGSRVDVIGYHMTVTSTAGAIRWFVDDKLLVEQVVAAVTVGASTPADSGFIDQTDATYGSMFPLVLAPGQVLKASTENSEASTAFAMGGEF